MSKNRDNFGERYNRVWIYGTWVKYWLNCGSVIELWCGKNIIMTFFFSSICWNHFHFIFILLFNSTLKTLSLSPFLWPSSTFGQTSTPSAFLTLEAFEKGNPFPHLLPQFVYLMLWKKTTLIPISSLIRAAMMI